MEIEAGQIWKLKNIKSRPNVEIVRYNKFSELVYIKYVDSNQEFEMSQNNFLRDFERAENA